MRFEHGRSNSMTNPDDLKEVVEAMHGGVATLSQSLPVIEIHEGLEVWRGIVHIFDLEGNALATRAYAWSSPVEGSDRRRFYAVLHIAPIDSPLAAVRAAIVAEHRQKAGG